MSSRVGNSEPLTVSQLDSFYGGDFQAASVVVSDGYRAVCATFEMAKRRGAIPRGRHMSEMLSSGSWTPPPLLTHERLSEVCRLTGQYLPDAILATVWYMLEHDCDEKRLVPALKIDRDSGHTVVVLSL